MMTQAYIYTFNAYLLEYPPIVIYDWLMNSILQIDDLPDVRDVFSAVIFIIAIFRIYKAVYKEVSKFRKLSLVKRKLK